MAKVYKTTFKLRRGKAAEWSQVNPILAQGEPAFELDTFKLKIGNGVMSYNELPYIADAAALQSSDSESSILFVDSKTLPALGGEDILYVVKDTGELKIWVDGEYVNFGGSTNLENYVTKDEIQNFVTKEETSNFVTKEETNNFVTNEQISNYVTNETFTETNNQITEQISQIDDKVTNVIEVSVEDVSEGDADNTPAEGDTLYVRKNGEWIPLNSDNLILQQITQQIIDESSRDYGSIDEIDEIV